MGRKKLPATGVIAGLALLGVVGLFDGMHVSYSNKTEFQRQEDRSADASVESASPQDDYDTWSLEFRGPSDVEGDSQAAPNANPYIREFGTDAESLGILSI